MDDADEKHQRLFASRYLKYLGNNKPTSNQIKEMESLLFHIWIRRNITFDDRLTEQERTCLYLASQGKSISETADLLSVSIDTVKAHRKAILNKLFCKNMTHAVSIGIKYGYVSRAEIT